MNLIIIVIVKHNEDNTTSECSNKKKHFTYTQQITIPSFYYITQNKDRRASLQKISLSRPPIYISPLPRHRAGTNETHSVTHARRPKNNALRYTTTTQSQKHFRLYRTRTRVCVICVYIRRARLITARACGRAARRKLSREFSLCVLFFFYFWAC